MIPDPLYLHPNSPANQIPAFTSSLLITFSFLSHCFSKSKNSTHRCVNYFPITTVTNYHKFSGLKQPRFIILQFWMSEVQNELKGAEIMVLVTFLPDVLGKNLLFVFPSFRRSLASSLISLWPLLLSSHFSWLWPTPSNPTTSSYKDPCDY